MNIVTSLFAEDIHQAREWFRTNTFSRGAVFASFLWLFALVGLGGYLLSRAFFTNLANYSTYGFLSAIYLLQAAIMVLGFLFSLTAAMTTVTSLLKPTKTICYLVTMPIHPADIAIWLFLKTCLINAFFLLVVLIPVGLAFGQQFFGPSLGFFLLRFTAGALLLVLITSAIGGIAGYLLALPLRRFATYGGLIGAACGIAVTVGMLRLIFPRDIVTLYNAAPDQFLAIYNHLPLTNQLFPTYWLTDAITTAKSQYLYPLLLFTIGIVGFSFLLEARRFLPVLQGVNGASTARKFKPAQAGRLTRSNYPLLQKDFLSLVRSPSEVSYGLFLLFMGVFFFFLLGVAQSVRPPGSRFAEVFVLFVFLWLLFFVTAYLLRLVFPLMAREGTGVWYLFTLPLKRERVLTEKLLLGTLLSLPYGAMAVILWLVFPVAGNYVLPVICLSLLSIVVLAAVQAVMGSICPNFKEGNSPERVSTSIMGIVTLLVSLLLAAIFALLAYLLVTGALAAPFVLLIGLEVGLFFVVLFWVLARSHLRRLAF